MDYAELSELTKSLAYWEKRIEDLSERSRDVSEELSAARKNFDDYENTFEQLINSEDVVNSVPYKDTAYWIAANHTRDKEFQKTFYDSGDTVPSTIRNGSKILILLSNRSWFTSGEVYNVSGTTIPRITDDDGDRLKLGLFGDIFTYSVLNADGNEEDEASYGKTFYDSGDSVPSTVCDGSKILIHLSNRSWFTSGEVYNVSDNTTLYSEEILTIEDDDGDNFVLGSVGDQFSYSVLNAGGNEETE